MSGPKKDGMLAKGWKGIRAMGYSPEASGLPDPVEKTWRNHTVWTGLHQFSAISWLSGFGELPENGVV